MSYQIKSLGYRTDFIFNRLDGSVEDKGEYIVAKTASNPNYFWGNLLLFKKPPEKGDLKRWREYFLQEFSAPTVFHMTFAWDSPNAAEGECDEFIKDGFELSKNIVLTTSSVEKSKKYNDEIIVRPIDLDTNLQRCVDIQLSGAATDKLAVETWRDFYLKSMVQFKVLTQSGHGKWFGAFLNSELVGSLGIFLDADVCRYQLVSTHKDFQRKGVCSSLVYESARYALEKMGAKVLVMVADEEYHAAKIYESVGFKPNQRQIGLCYWDKEKHK